jgi:hypothetical protein
VRVFEIDPEVVVAHHRSSTPAADVAELQTNLDPIELDS